MAEPTFADYVDLLFTLFERFWQHHSTRPHRGHPFVYKPKALIVFFVVMQQRCIFRFRAQCRWLKRHPEMQQAFGLDHVPHRTTISRRYKTRYAVLQDFITFSWGLCRRPRSTLYLQGQIFSHIDTKLRNCGMRNAEQAFDFQF